MGKDRALYRGNRFFRSYSFGAKGRPSKIRAVFILLLLFWMDISLALGMGFSFFWAVFCEDASLLLIWAVLADIFLGKIVNLAIVLSGLAFCWFLDRWFRMGIKQIFPIWIMFFVPMMQLFANRAIVLVGWVILNRRRLIELAVENRVASEDLVD